MDYKTDDINFERVASLMGVVEKVTTVCPMNTAILAAAMAELKEVNEKLDERIKEAGKKRLRVEQERAAKINEQRLRDVEDQARRDADQRAFDKTKATLKTHPYNVMPGEPNELVEAERRLATQESETSEPDVRRI